MNQPNYRAGINLEKDDTQADLVALLRADPGALAAAQAERDLLHSENEAGAHDGRGGIFQRCYVSRTIYQALDVALKQVEAP